MKKPDGGTVAPYEDRNVFGWRSCIGLIGHHTVKRKLSQAFGVLLTYLAQGKAQRQDGCPPGTGQGTEAGWLPS